VTNLLNAGPGSLRQALLDTPAGGTVDFQPGLSGTITLTSGELAIAKDLTVAGPGEAVLTVSGNHASRVFDIAAPFTVSLAGLTIADGFTTGSGGGIFNAGVLTVTDSTLSGNSSSGGFPSGGGGIYNIGMLTVTDSTLSGNSASGFNEFGGGIYNNAGTLTVTDSTLSDNSVGTAGSGGGIISLDGPLTVTGSTLSGNSAVSGGGICILDGPLTVTDSTISGNSAAANSGGGIESAGVLTLTVTGSTISGNSARGTGGGIDHGGGTLTVTDSTLSGNSAGDDGGGIFNFGPGTVTVTDSALSGNSAGIFGGGIDNNFGTVTVTDSALSDNSAGTFGGGIDNEVGNTLTVTDSTLSGNTAGGAGSGIYNTGLFAVRGLVTIDGDYFQTAGGTFDLVIGGPRAGTDYSQLAVSGLATLGGTVAVHLVNGFQPQPGDLFQVLTAGQVSGTFSQYTLDSDQFAFVYVFQSGYTADFATGLTLEAN
jgi:hypothetical protein